MRLIDADALIPKEVHTIIRLTATGEQTESVVYADQIDNAPTVDAVERKRGEWVEEPNCWYRCSNCGKHYPSMRGYMDYNFCPNCGADMRGENNGNNVRE